MSAKPTPGPGFWRGTIVGGIASSMIWGGLLLWVLVACGLTGCAGSGPPAEGAPTSTPVTPPDYTSEWTLSGADNRKADQARQIAVRAAGTGVPVDFIIALSAFVLEWEDEMRPILEDRITQAVLMPFGPVFDLPDTVEVDRWSRVALERSGNTLVVRPLPTLDAAMYDALLRAGEAEAAEKWKDEPRDWEVEE